MSSYEYLTVILIMSGSFILGMATGAYIEQREKMIPVETHLQKLCVNSNSELNHYTKREVYCENGAVFKRDKEL